MKGLPARKSKPGAVPYDYRRYVRLSIQLSHWLLRPMGVWPRSAESPWMMKYVDILINVICTGLISFIFVPCILYVVFEVEDTYNTLKFSGPLSYLLMVIAKYYSLISHETDLRRCIEHIESDWMNTRHYSDRAIMIKNAEFGRRLVAICTFFTYGGLAFYHVALPISRGKITEEDSNLTYQPLVYPVARMILDTRHSPVSEIFFWMQCLAGFFAQSVLAASCGLAATLAMHAHGRMEVLIEWLLHLVDGREDFSDNVDKRLTMIVQQHVQILRFVSLIEKVLHEISLVETVGCTLNMCFLGYYVIMEWETGEIASYVTYTVLLISFTFNIFIFCYIGELVAEQSKRVSEISYMIDWHRLPGKKALSITLVIAISNSIKLSAGNLIELSLTSFGDVVKASVAYLNMLRTLTT